MADTPLKKDPNYQSVAGGITDDAAQDVKPFRVNPSTYRLLTEAIAAPSSSVGSGSIAVTTAGTRVQLPTVSCSRVFIQANGGNTGDLITVGDGSVSAGTPLATNRRGLALYTTQGAWFNVSNLNLLWIDSLVNNDHVNYYYEV